jgi:hypothetical protein
MTSYRTEQILNALGNLAATDSWHDFHHDIGDISKVISDNSAIYISGLPKGVTDLSTFNSEAAALSRVVDLIGSAKENDFASRLVSETNRDPYYITTINGIKYNVIPKSVATGSSTTGNKEYIPAIEFDRVLQLENNCAIIVDAAAVSLLEILKKGDPVHTSQGSGVQKNIYYVMTPEVVNDPAGKTRLDNEVFRHDPGHGFKLTPCESNVPPSINYTYSYDNKIVHGNDLKNMNITAYNKFFTAYTFQLSELQPIKKGKKIDYTTNLLITPGDKTLNIRENIIDSKKQNDITSLASLLHSIIGYLQTNPKTNHFLFNTKLQQKRSGDWLQVLVCLLLKSRELKKFVATGPSDETEIQNNISKVYFVTHDRVALAFALLIGVDCIFTHGSSKSCYIFKKPNILIPSEQLPPDAPFEEKIHANLQALQTLRQNLANVLSKFTTLERNYAFYNSYRDESIVQFYEEKILSMNTSSLYESFFSDGSKFNASIFNKFTNDLFETCLLYNYLLLNYPNPEEQLKKIINYLRILPGLVNAKIAETSAITGSLILGENTATLNKEAVDIFNLLSSYEDLMSCFTTLESVVNKYVDETGTQIKCNMQTSISSFQKTPDRKNAVAWSWDNTTISSRIWSSLTGASDHKTDKNTFLYKLDLLPEHVRSKIAEYYLNILERIKHGETQGNYYKENSNKGVEGNLSRNRIPKFKGVAEGFVAEVLLNFAFIPVNDQFDSVSVSAATTSTGISVFEARAEDIIHNAFINPIVKILSDEAIVSENSTATQDVFEKKKLSETMIKEICHFNFSTDVKTIKSPELIEGEYEVLVKQIDDDKAYAASENEKKIKLERETLEALEEESKSSTPIDTSFVDTEIIETRENLEKLQEQSTALPPVVPKDDDDTIHIVPLFDTESIRETFPIKKGSRRLEGDFETSNKSATYVLLNAALDYKSDIKGILHLLIAAKILKSDYNPSGATLRQGTKVRETALAKAAIDKDVYEKAYEDEDATTRGGSQRGGSTEEEIISALTDLFEKIDLSESTSSSSEEIDQSNLLQSFISIFHPLMPIYMIAESLNQIVHNDKIEDSLDYELYHKYYVFLNELRDNLVQTYSSNKPLDIISAFVIGLGLREFLFRTDVYSLKVESTEPYCQAIMGVSHPHFLPISILTGLLKDFISGNIRRTHVENANGEILLKNRLFVEYIQKINLNDIFQSDIGVDSENPQVVETFKSNCFDFLISTGNIIISDRTGGVGDQAYGFASGIKTDIESDLHVAPPKPWTDQRVPNAFSTNSFETAISTYGGNTHKNRLHKRTLKRNRKTKHRVTHFYRNKLKKYTRKHKPKKI